MNRWEHCVTHANEEAETFVSDYFSDKKRNVLLIAGAGFDPRSTVVAQALAPVAQSRRAIFIREERPNPAEDLVSRAENNVKGLASAFPQHEIVRISIFDNQDGAVVGAKRLIREIDPIVRKDESFTDIVLDLSALSIGISFPLVRYIYTRYGQKKEGQPVANIHLFVAEDSSLDSDVTSEHMDRGLYIPGFEGNAMLDSESKSTRLWVPQLVSGRNDALRRIHQFVGAEETCPILPFPSKNLRRSDELLEKFITEVQSAWEVDPRNYIYAAEGEPVDLYRTLLRLDDARMRVYQDHGGSMIILSPIGSRVLAIGALLAALERKFPVAYLESVSYAFKANPGELPPAHKWPLAHIWLSGDAYA